MNISILEYKPSELLQPYVEFFWKGDFNSESTKLLSQQVVPNGYVELIIHLSDLHCELYQGSGFGSSPDYTLIGLFTRPYEVHFKSKVEVFGIRFKPEGIYHLFGIPAAEVLENFADMESVTGQRFKEFCSRLRERTNEGEMISLAENYLLRNLDRNNLNLYYLNRAAHLIRTHNGLLSIEELARKVYISARQLEREFKQKIGITPKQYMRLAKLNAVNRMLDSGQTFNLTRLAYDCGYFDQAHFIRDFRNFTGEKPTVFIRERESFIVNAGDATAR